MAVRAAARDNPHMSEQHRQNSGPWGRLTGIGGRAAASTLRPVAGIVGKAAAAGVVVERRAVDLLLDSPELERTINVAVDSVRVQASLERALQSDNVKRLVDNLFDSGLLDQLVTRMFDTGLFDRVIDQMFDSGLFDRILERLLASDGLWNMIDEIAASDSVTAAISQQGLGFADQVTDQVRDRSRKADDWLERAARRLAHRPPRALPPEPEPGV